jgi:xanthine/uracil permease
MGKDFVDIHETPPLSKWIPLSLQHLFAIIWCNGSRTAHHGS